MHLQWLGRGAVFLGMALVLATVVPATAGGEGEEKPYRIVDGKVDFGTYNGYRRYHNSCHRCHGPDAIGSSFAPPLIESLRVIDEETFFNIVVNGRIDGRVGNPDDDTRPVASSSAAGEKKVMPAFYKDPNVMDYLDDIYAYIKARSDGVLGGGRPPHLPKEKTD
ncbi:MAG: c-type cytochrome [Rhodospirillales bacterium]